MTSLLYNGGGFLPPSQREPRPLRYPQGEDIIPSIVTLNIFGIMLWLRANSFAESAGKGCSPAVSPIAAFFSAVASGEP